MIKECPHCDELVEYQSACSMFDSELVEEVPVCLNKKCDYFDKIIEDDTW